MRERIPITEYHARLRAQDVPRNHLAMVCPICKTIQSAHDLIATGAGPTFEEVEKYLGFSCVGRFSNAPEWTKDTPPGQGCNWTLGGLLRLHELEVTDEEGKHHPRFVLATPEEATAHMDQHAAKLPPGEIFCSRCGLRSEIAAKQEKRLCLHCVIETNSG